MRPAPGTGTVKKLKLIISAMSDSFNNLYYKASLKLKSGRRPRRSAGSADISTWNFAAQPNLYGSSIDGVGAYTSAERYARSGGLIVGANSINGQSENNDGIVIDKRTDFANAVSASGTSSHSTGIVVRGLVNGITNLHGEGQIGIKIDGASGQIANNSFPERAGGYNMIIEGVGIDIGVDILKPLVTVSGWNGRIVITGSGRVSLTGTATGVNGIGIFNNSNNLSLERYGTPESSGNNDLITGIATGTGGIGIYNSGSIKTERGMDTIDAITGGFKGGGKYELGDDDDTVKGFGTGYFYGGNGKDSLYLPSGSYELDKQGLGQDYNITSMATGEIMHIANFETLYVGTTLSDLPIRNTTILTG